MSTKFYNRSVLERRDVEKPAIEYAIMRGWWHTKVGALTRTSQPDDLFVRNGQYLWIEFKAPGEEPRALQLKRHRDMRAKGMDVRWTDNLDQAKEWLK